MKKIRKKYSADFETTTKVEDCRVWAYGYMEIGNNKNYHIGNNIDDFMEFCENSLSDIYFHNLKFDGSFIINWLLKNGFTYGDKGLEKTFDCVISNMGQWYMITINYGFQGKSKKYTNLYDSLKKLPFTIKKIATDFQLDVLKGDIDYHKEREKGHIIDDDEYKYINNDIEILAKALDIQFKEGLTGMTNGQDSMRSFKSSIPKKMYDKLFPTFSLPLNENMRLYYRGGFTWLNDKYKDKEVGEGIVFDVNSLYPSVMYDKNLPIGFPQYFDGEYKDDKDYPLYLQHIRCEFELKKDKIPTIQIKRNMSFVGNEYLKSSNGDVVDLYLTNIDLEIVKEHYNLYGLEYISGWKFRQRKGVFKKFIDKWTYVKVNNDGAVKTLAKLMLNSLYGKFATNPNITGKVPYLKEDGSNGFSKGEEEFKDPIYTPMGVFITSYARAITITTGQKVFNRLIYCDTDSIHLEGTKTPLVIKDIIHDSKLGYWQHESTYKRGKYLRQKTYIQDIYKKDNDGNLTKDTELSVKCSGMSDRVKKVVTFDNFKTGFVSGIDGEKYVLDLYNKLPEHEKKNQDYDNFRSSFPPFSNLTNKQVSGGVVLLDSDFTIK